jgi:hypothetical protein
MEIFFRDLGGALGINAAQNILGSFLRAGLDGSAPALPGISSSSVANEGISDLVKLAHKLPAEGQALFATIMNGAITRAFILPIVATSLAAVVSLGIERKLLEDDTEMEGYKAVPEYELEDSSPR